MDHWLFWYLTWAILIRNEGVVPINMTETLDIENDVVSPIKQLKKQMKAEFNIFFDWLVSKNLTLNYKKKVYDYL